MRSFAGIIIGLLIGGIALFTIGAASYLPHLEWLRSFMMPAFYLVGIPSAVALALLPARKRQRKPRQTIPEAEACHLQP